MFINFIVGMVIGVIINCIIFLNFKKLKFFIHKKMLLFVIAIALFFTYTSLQTFFGFGTMIPTIIGGFVTPINMMIFIYLIVSRKKANEK